LGNEYVQQLASKVGISPDRAGSMLAGILPVIVDKLTPNGQLPASSGGGCWMRPWVSLKEASVAIYL